MGLVLGLAACSSSEEEGSDAGVVMTYPDAAVFADAETFPDAVAPPLDCVCDEVEPCQECFEHIGRCCYDDPTIGGRGPLIANNCETHAACRVCCRECVEASCEQIRLQNSCPNDPKQ